MVLFIASKNSYNFFIFILRAVSVNTSVAEKIDYTENVVIIEGGNHAQFGNYGPQKGDTPAAVSDTEQQAITVSAITDFVA